MDYNSFLWCFGNKLFFFGNFSLKLKEGKLKSNSTHKCREIKNFCVSFLCHFFLIFFFIFVFNSLFFDHQFASKTFLMRNKRSSSTNGGWWIKTSINEYFMSENNKSKRNIEMEVFSSGLSLKCVVC